MEKNLLENIEDDNNNFNKYLSKCKEEGFEAEKAIIALNNDMNTKDLELTGVLEILGKLDKSLSVYVQEYNLIQEEFQSVKERIKEVSSVVQKIYIESIELLSESVNVYLKIYLLSFLMEVSSDAKYINELLFILINNNMIDSSGKFFLLYQCIRKRFVKLTATDNKTPILIRKVYRTIYNEFKIQIANELEFISKEERNEDFIVVITGQLLGLGHAPTKTALDRCYNLMKHLGKTVILINTTELMTSKGLLPFYNTTFANRAQEFTQLDSMPYKDISIPFYQTEYLMPDIEEIKNILNIIKRYKPYFIMSIGSANLTADLCSNLVPVVDIATVYSGLPLTESQFHVIGRKATQGDIDFLNQFGFGEENIIESIFTFDFKPQENTYTREELALPQDKFLLAIVGARLDEEVTDEFIEAMQKTSDIGTYMVFIGNFNKYHNIVKYNKKFANNSTYLGFQKDVLAVLELCDLYVNPLRVGGGSSSVEALFKGVPALSFNKGDVAVAIGDDFCVDSYFEMTEMIKKYLQNKEFYSRMSKKARERADIMLNTHKELNRIINKVVNSQLFK